MAESIFMKLGMYIMALEAHLNGVIHKSLPSVCVSIFLVPIVGRQRFGKNITAETNTQATIE
jgi:hypothetical protein